MRLTALAFVLLIAASALAQQDAGNARRAFEAIEAQLKQQPEDATLWFYLARFQAEAGNKAACVAAMEKVLAHGEGFLPARGNGFERVWDDPAFQDVTRRLEAKLPRLDFHPTALELSERGIIPEGIAFDPKALELFMGSIARKRILRIDASGTPHEFAGPDSGLEHVLGIALDVPRRTLYAVSTSELTGAGRKQPRNAIFAFDVDTGKLLRKVEVAGARALNDVAVARGGRVFTSDSQAGMVYEIPAVGPPRALMPEGRLPGANGLAASADAKRLYVAHSTGIAVVDIAGDAPLLSRLPLPPRENAAAIDGLYEWRGALIGVQNLTTPGRVIHLELSPDGRTVTRLRTLVSHHHTALFEPTTGVPTDLGFYLLAATGVTRFTNEGRIENPASVPKPLVLKVPLPR